MSTLSILKFRTRLFAAVLAITPLSAALHAQDVGMLASVNVPFAFETGAGHQFGPGVYTIRVENPHTLLIMGKADSGFTRTSVEDTAQPASKSKAAFHKYGDHYFLTEITVEGSSRRLYFSPSKAERAFQVAGHQTVPPNVELALSQAVR